MSSFIVLVVSPSLNPAVIAHQNYVSLTYFTGRNRPPKKVGVNILLFRCLHGEIKMCNRHIQTTKPHNPWHACLLLCSASCYRLCGQVNKNNFNCCPQSYKARWKPLENFSFDSVHRQTDRQTNNGTDVITLPPCRYVVSQLYSSIFTVGYRYTWMRMNTILPVM